MRTGATPDPSAQRPSASFLLASMVPPRPADLDAEKTHVGATLVGAPALRPRLETDTKHAYLTVIAGARAGEIFRLAAHETVLGRGSQCNVHLDSDGVSRRHARIVLQGQDYFVEDLGSTNGTWVDDQRVRVQKLEDGDRIQIGTEVIVRFAFHDDLEAQLQQQLYESAVRDPLTRAYNRKHFQERLRAEVGHAVRHHTQLSLVFLDVDFFKRVNDTYGHPAGDAVLKSISSAIQKAIRVEDLFARVGGEEFALLARGIDGVAAGAFAERLRRGVERLPIHWGTTSLFITCSFGVATLNELPTQDGDALVALADRRLYQAKSGGRNRVVGPEAT